MLEQIFHLEELKQSIHLNKLELLQPSMEEILMVKHLLILQ